MPTGQRISLGLTKLLATAWTCLCALTESVCSQVFVAGFACESFGLLTQCEVKQQFGGLPHVKIFFQSWSTKKMLMGIRTRSELRSEEDLFQVKFKDERSHCNITQQNEFRNLLYSKNEQDLAATPAALRLHFGTPVLWASTC